MTKSNAPMSLIAAFYDDERHARSALGVLKGLEKNHAVRILDGAIMRCDKKTNKLKIDEMAEITARKGAVRGAIAGGLLAVIFPPSILALGLTGAAVGAAYGHFSDQGFNNNLLKEVAENMPPGGAALVAVVEELWVNTVSDVIAGYEDLRLYRLEAEAAEHLGKRAS